MFPQLLSRIINSKKSAVSYAKLWGLTNNGKKIRMEQGCEKLLKTGQMQVSLQKEGKGNVGEK